MGNRKSCVAAIAQLQDGSVLGSILGIVAETDPLIAEVLAARQVVKWANDKQWSYVLIEGDSQNVVHSIMLSHLKPHWSVSLIIQDIKDILHQHPEWEFGHTRRTTNGAAHELARWGLAMGYIGTLQSDQLPNSTKNQVELDACPID